MSQKAIREFDGKRLLLQHFQKYFSGDEVDLPKIGARSVQVDPTTDLESLPSLHPWLLNTPLVCKPDQLIKRRGKSNLLLLNADFAGVKAWLVERRNKAVTIGSVTGKLTHFLIEPFIPHAAEEEMYVCIHSVREGDEVLFYHAGGVDIGDVDAKASRLLVPTGGTFTATQALPLLAQAPAHLHARLSAFLAALFGFYTNLFFAYFEINPLVVSAAAITPLDIAAKVDQTAEYLCERQWGSLPFPPPFGRDPYPEEEYIASLDAMTGASLKLTILNLKGKVWMMVAGGGASVVYADAVADLGWGREMANYGEYSGDPSDALTFEYAKTIISMMVRPDPDAVASSTVNGVEFSRKFPGITGFGKALIVGGGIANFTNVAATFKGIIKAMKLYAKEMRETGVRVYVRRGGPNYQEALRKIKEEIGGLGIFIKVYGPETHITSIVALAVGVSPAEPCEEYGEEAAVVKGAGELLKGRSFTNLMAAEEEEQSMALSSSSLSAQKEKEKEKEGGGSALSSSSASAAGQQQSGSEVLGDGGNSLISATTRCIVYGLQTKAVQRMLDFDYISKRKASVAAMVYPFAGDHYQKFHWGAEEVLLPVYEKMSSALSKFPDVDTVINFASFRSVFKSVTEALAFPQIKLITIIAEGVPEQHTKQLIQMAAAKRVTLIGPATVGGIKAGCFRVGNTGGAMDNIIASRLYRPGSVAYVSKSGGMSNELNNIIARHTDGVYEGVAIGGDRFPGTVFIDHVMRFERDPHVKLIVLLGEVGGGEEYRVAEAIAKGEVKKPMVAWCVGTCAKLFPYEVQFGHAGAIAGGEGETADEKNAALARAGAKVPASFEAFGHVIREVFEKLVRDGVIVRRKESPVPVLPMDFDWAQKLGLIRKPASFISTITDDRGEELLYAGMPISKVFEEQLGIGGVISLLWFKRRLPQYACSFIEMVLMVTADHGPAVSGAHNTIVATRAGKDLISSLCSGLLTIGPRFGGALDDAAKQFSGAVDAAMTPVEFIDAVAKQKELIMGIGHKVKSLQNPDMRVVIVKEYAKKHFPNTKVLDFALEVEKETTKKRPNLILNVDGAIACAFVDLLRSCGAFTKEESDEYVNKSGLLNALFVLGRSIGFIGHHIDQKRLRQGLYRHDTADVAYVLNE